MGVLAIWRYPIKAMLGEALSAARVGRTGIAGDRRWVVVDEATGERIASKRGRTDARLRACRAELGPGEDLESLRVTLPSGEPVLGADVPAALSELLGTAVGLEEASGEEARLGAPAGHQDFAPLHLIAEATLRFLAGLEPASHWDPRRFRANLLLGGGASGAFVEDSLIGSELRGRDGLRISVAIPTPRCVVTTRATEELPADPSVLRTVARRHMLDLGPYGRGACLGAYAEVQAEGDLAVGDRLEVLAPPAGATS